MQSETIGTLASALAKAQGEFGAAKFNRVNPHFKSKYADLTAVIDAIRAPLSKNGIAWVQTIEPVNGAGMVLTTTLVHGESGEWVRSIYPLPAATAPQQFGSALTYAKRYSLAAIVGVSADEDDDANVAQKGTNGNGHHAGDKISDGQVDALQSAIVEVGANIDKFLAYLKVESLSDLPAGRYGDAMAALDARRTKQ
jgi:hypothetical protein